MHLHIVSGLLYLVVAFLLHCINMSYIICDLHNLVLNLTNTSELISSFVWISHRFKIIIGYTLKTDIPLICELFNSWFLFIEYDKFLILFVYLSYHIMYYYFLLNSHVTYSMSVFMSIPTNGDWSSNQFVFLFNTPFTQCLFHLTLFSGILNSFLVSREFFL